MAQGLTNLIHKDTGDGTILILPWAYSGITQGTWALLINAAYSWNYLWYNSTAAEGDQIDYKVWLSKGVWLLSMCAYFSTTYSFCEALIDGTTVAGLNVYSATSTYAYASFAPDIYIPTTGLKTLSLRAKTSFGGDQSIVFHYLLLTRAN